MIECSNIHISLSPERTNHHDDTSMQIANMLQMKGLDMSMLSSPE